MRVMSARTSGNRSVTLARTAQPEHPARAAARRRRARRRTIQARAPARPRPGTGRSSTPNAERRHAAQRSHTSPYQLAQAGSRPRCSRMPVIDGPAPMTSSGQRRGAARPHERHNAGRDADQALDDQPPPGDARPHARVSQRSGEDPVHERVGPEHENQRRERDAGQTQGRHTGDNRGHAAERQRATVPRRYAPRPFSSHRVVSSTRRQWSLFLLATARCAAVRSPTGPGVPGQRRALMSMRGGLVTPARHRLPGQWPRCPRTAVPRRAEHRPQDRPPWPAS